MLCRTFAILIEDWRTPDFEEQSADRTILFIENSANSNRRQGRIMNRHFLLSVTSLAVLTLPACSDSSEAPDIPDPDAGMPVTSEPASPAQDEDSAEEETVTPPGELAERRQQIEQEANQAFEAI